MNDPFLPRLFGLSLDALAELDPAQRASAIRQKVSDLHFFMHDGQPLAARAAPQQTLRLASGLAERLSQMEPQPADDAASRHDRIITDPVLRAEADRDQNVYLGSLFTRVLTRAVPDLIFQPASPAETAEALRWARAQGVPVTVRGAASTALGGAVPDDGGLTLDLARLDAIEVDAAGLTCTIGAGARFRDIHRRLACSGLALGVYPSTLGGTFPGWFVTGGLGLNAFGRGSALDIVRAADVLLPSGDIVRYHADGRVEAGDVARPSDVLSEVDAANWFRDRGLPRLTLGDFAGSEGILGVVLRVVVSVEPRPCIGAFLLSFATARGALDAARWIAAESGTTVPQPANLKFFAGSHMHETRRIWVDEDAREWRKRPSALSAGEGMPWTMILGPADLGIPIASDRHEAGGYVYVDFLDPVAAQAFGNRLPALPGQPAVLGAESVRVAAERFKPQQNKRLGPGLLAAEIRLPAPRVAGFLDHAEALARGAGVALDPEVYFTGNGGALVIAGYLTDHRTAAFHADLVLAPALLDMAIARHDGAPYVLGRWQSPFARNRYTPEALRELSKIKATLDPTGLLNHGVIFGLHLRGVFGGLVARSYRPGISLLRHCWDTPPLAALLRGKRALLRWLPGPAAGRGEPVGSTAVLAPLARALHCVNCGECNSVCPVFCDSKIRLPQTLTHVGEATYAREDISVGGSTLLDLCMRCGDCEEVCQAGIPHLAMYERMQAASNDTRGYNQDRHVAILATLRSSPRYLRDFLNVRPGGYLERAPASLPGTVSYLLLRAESDQGPAATCVHCGACVPVCPTKANVEFKAEDARIITTEQDLCIGCGTCVEVCPANQANGGQTLRVMEAPTRDWFAALDEFDAGVPR